jgi:hypothetical protein
MEEQVFEHEGLKQENVSREMTFAIDVRKLTRDSKYIATVDWHKYDGGKVGTPGTVAYGDSETEAYYKLKKNLIDRGFKIK